MNYDDIIDLPHYHDPDKPFMSHRDRAAQFAPFKSLVGYDQMIAKKTDEILKQDDQNRT